MKKKTKLLLGLGFASVALISIPTTVVLTSCAGDITGVNFTNKATITAKAGATSNALQDVNVKNIKTASNSSFTVYGMLVLTEIPTFANGNSPVIYL